MNLLYKEFRQIISNKLFIGTWIVVLILLCVFMSADIEDTKSDVPEIGARIGVINNDTSSYADMFVDFIMKSDELARLVNVEVGKKKDIEEKFYAGKLDAYVEIPQDFINSLMDIEEMPLSVTISDNNTVTTILIKNYVDSFESYVRAIQMNITSLYNQLRLLDTGESKAKMKCFNVTYVLVKDVFEKERFVDTVEVEDLKVSTVVVYLIYAAITIVIMYGSLFAGVDILKEKSYWVLNRYLISGSSAIKFIVTKLLFYTVALYMLILIPTLVSDIYNGNDTMWLTLVLYFVFIMTCISFSIFLCFLMGNTISFTLTGNMLYIVSIIIGGGIIPVMYMPVKLAEFAKYTPTYMFINSFINAHNNKGFDSVKTPVLICGLITVLCISASTVLFKKVFTRQE